MIYSFSSGGFQMLKDQMGGVDNERKKKVSEEDDVCPFP